MHQRPGKIKHLAPHYIWEGKENCRTALTRNNGWTMDYGRMDNFTGEKKCIDEDQLPVAPNGLDRWWALYLFYSCAEMQVFM